MHHDCGVSQCGKPAQDNICPSCTAELVAALKAIATGGVQRVRIHRDWDPETSGYVKREEVDYLPGLWEDLETTLTRQAKMGGAGIKVMGSGESPTVFHEGASEVKTMAFAAIRHWKARFAHENPHLAAGPEAPADVCGWLASFPALLASLADAAAMHDDFLALAHPKYGSIQRVIDRAPDRMFLGICSAPVEGEPYPCGEDVYAWKGDMVTTCRVCRTHHDVEVRRDIMRAALERVDATAVDCSRLSATFDVDVSVDRIRQWKKRDQITVRGHDDRGRPLYRMRDVLNLAARLRLEKAS